eukprot:g6858.t1
MTRKLTGDTGNKIYARIRFGTTFYGFGNLVQLNFKLPLGYACVSANQGGSVRSPEQRRASTCRVVDGCTRNLQMTC